MAQTSYFYDGTTLGDASLAPYDDGEFTSPHRLYGDFVLPEYLNELLVEDSATNGIVTVATGAAMVYGTLYENDASVNVAIAAAVNNRIDRIVLRFTAGATQTTRITKITGIEAANPSPPALGATDFALAWVWIPAGYNPATTPINDEDVHDERLFKHTGAQSIHYTSENMMPNSEFFGYSGGAAGTLPPDRWELDGVPSTAIGNANLANFPDQIRGQSVRIQSNAGHGMQTRIILRNTYATALENMTVTVKGALYITSGSVQITVRGLDYTGAATNTEVRDYYRTGVVQEFMIRTVLTGNPIKEMLHISILADSAGSDFYVGQLIVVAGYVPGPFRPKHEIVYFDNDVLDVNWNATAKSTGATFIRTTTAFGAVIPPYYRGLIMRLRGRDSGSAADNTLVMWTYHIDTLLATQGVQVGGVSNDTWRESLAYVPVKLEDANADIGVSIVASGVLTFDATVQPIGIIT